MNFLVCLKINKKNKSTENSITIPKILKGSINVSSGESEKSVEIMTNDNMSEAVSREIKITESNNLIGILCLYTKEKINVARAKVIILTIPA